MVCHSRTLDMDCCFRFLLVQTDVRMTQACCQQFHLNLPEQFDFVQTVSEPKRIRQKHTITNPAQLQPGDGPFSMPWWSRPHLSKGKGINHRKLKKNSPIRNIHAILDKLKNSSSTISQPNTQRSKAGNHQKSQLAALQLTTCGSKYCKLKTCRANGYDRKYGGFPKWGYP